MAENSTYQPTDPLISSNFSPFAVSVSRVRTDAQAGVLPQARVQESSMSRLPAAVAPTPGSGANERAPLLGNTPSKKPFYRPRPLWLVPFAIVASIVRGMTLAPRVQVYTQLSCNAVYGHDVYDHTSYNTSPSALSVDSTHTMSHAPFYLSLDPAGPHLDPRFLNLSDIIAAPRPRPHDPQSYVSFGNNDQDDDDDDEPDPRTLPSKRCLTDPAVQAGAARIQTMMTTVMGALSALTTGWWGHFGEHHGRTRVLAASTLGLFLTDVTFILVSTPHSPFAAHGHKLLILSPIIEGFLGGWSTLQGATSAYISDCTSDGSRAQIFSRFTGVFYLGFSVGPTLGAYLIRHPLLSFPGSPSSSAGHAPNVHNGQPTVTSVFYVAAMCSFVNLLLVLFVFPESTDKKKAKAAQSQNAVAALAVAALEGTREGGPPDQVNQMNLLQCSLVLLSLFTPKKIPKLEGGYRKDWSLTLLGIALFMFLLAAGIFQIKYLYAEHVYEWGAEQLSYYITLVGAVRAVHLLFVMPHLISTFKPKPKQKTNISHSVSGSVSTAVIANAGSTAPAKSVSAAHAQAKKPKATLAHLAREVNFDILLLRLSFFMECLSHSLVAFLPSYLGQGFFVAFTTLSCFGAGVIPAANSLALCIMQMQAQETRAAGGVDDDDGGAGRLFGALAALQAVGQMILGPLIFGVVYSSTVAVFPRAIFVTAAGITLVAIALLCLLRPDVAMRAKQQRRVRRDEEIERGRSRISKDLSKSVSPILIPQASTSTTGSGSDSDSHQYKH